MDQILIAMESFFTSLRGFECMSAFQLFRGYSPSTFGVPRQKISQNMIDAHDERINEGNRIIDEIQNRKHSGLRLIETQYKSIHVLQKFKTELIEPINRGTYARDELAHHQVQMKIERASNASLTRIHKFNSQWVTN